MERQGNRIILCLGSNRDRERNIGRATELLRKRFAALRFSPSYYTDPVGCGLVEPFLNRVAIGYCGESAGEIRSILKKIEQSLGRQANEKAIGIVRIDIDLLQWNGEVLKADDLARDYVRLGLSLLLAAAEEEEGGE